MTSQEEFEDDMNEFLAQEIPTEMPEELYKFAAKAESYTYYVAKKQARFEKELAIHERALAETKKSMPQYKGTAGDRQAQWESETAVLAASIELCKADIRYYKNLGKILENKISLIQSILANITASIKAGAYLDNVSRA